MLLFYASEARACFDIEGLYKDMVVGQNPYEGWSFDEWLEENPIPDAWIKRLERDEQDKL